MQRRSRWLACGALLVLTAASGRATSWSVDAGAAGADGGVVFFVLDGPAREAVRQVIHDHRRETRACIERQFERSDDRGKLVVHFIIGGDGTVRVAKVMSATIDAPLVGECLTKVIAGWRFPPHDGGVVSVNYPFMISER